MARETCCFIESDCDIGMTAANPSWRKLAGLLALIAYLLAYAVLALAVAMILQVNSGAVTEWVYYIVAGLAWVPGAAWIVSWMHRD